MKVCPNCGCLNEPNSDTCSMCKTKLEEKEKKVVVQEKKEISKEVESGVENGKFFNKTYIENASLIDDDNKIIKSDYVAPKKDMSTLKAAILSIVVVVIIIVSVFLGLYFGWFNPRHNDEEMLNSVKNQCLNYEKVIINYLNKYDYKSQSNKNYYTAKGHDYTFVEFNISEECKYNNNTYNDMFCEQLFNDINNNYCRSTKCDIPTSYTIKINVKDKENIEENSIVTKSFTIDNYTTLTYDDVECNKINNVYSCEYKNRS